MSRLRRALYLAVVLLATACKEEPLPGVEYSFSSEVESEELSKSYSGSASVAGDFATLEFEEGDGLVWKEHVLLITSDGGKTFTVVLPKQKKYYETSESEARQAQARAIRKEMSRRSFEIEDVDSSLVDEGRDVAILDYPTRRYRHEMSYHMMASVQGRGVSGSAQIVTKIWTTSMIAERYADFLRQQQVSTGVGKLDEVMVRDLKGVRGFRLKEVSTLTASVENARFVSTATTTVDEFRETDIPYSRFEVPEGFEEMESPSLAETKEE